MANKFSKEQKKLAVERFNGMGKGMKSAIEVGKEYGVHYTTIYGWAAALNKPTVKAAKTVKAKSTPKPKKNNATQSKNGTSKTKPVEDEWEAAFNDWIAKRNAAREAVKAEEEASKKLKKLVEQLR